MMGDLFAGHPDLVTDLLAGIKRYASGAAAPAIWEGYASAGAPICLVIAGLAPAGIIRAIEYRINGGELLLDSGAFGFRDKPSQMPWNQVMHGYHAVMAPIGTRCCYILPDVVGDQAGTLELARSLRPMLEHLARLDHDALIPVQRGPMSITAFVAAYRQAMGGIPVSGLAIPSNAAAMPVEELKGLAHVEDISRRVHFLGISRRARPLLDRARALAEFWPDVAISADACEHRAHVGRTRAITRSRASHLATLVANSWKEYDETEDGPLFESDHDPVREKLQGFFPDADEETLNDLIASGWGLSIQFELAGERFVSQNGPLATTHSIHEFARSQFGRAGL